MKQKKERPRCVNCDEVMDGGHCYFCKYYKNGIVVKRERQIRRG